MAENQPRQIIGQMNWQSSYAVACNSTTISLSTWSSLCMIHISYVQLTKQCFYLVCDCVYFSLAWHRLTFRLWFRHIIWILINLFYEDYRTHCRRNYVAYWYFWLTQKYSHGIWKETSKQVIIFQEWSEFMFDTITMKTMI